MPELLGVPPFAPVRVSGRARRLRRAVRRRRRALAAGIALTAAALAASAAQGARPGGDDEAGGGRGSPATAAERTPRPAVARVSAPVRIADAETVRLLRPGDRVDVIATPSSGPETGEIPDARVVARGVRVAEVPALDQEPAPTPADATDPAGPTDPVGPADPVHPADPVRRSGALVVLSVPRSVAAELAAASATGTLAVAVC